jgi:hypothetical protein
MNLNGIGKWKGRHITCTVRLVGGPYDALLEWPCDLSVNIVLKDQPANRNQVYFLIASFIEYIPLTLYPQRGNKSISRRVHTI